MGGRAVRVAVVAAAVAMAAVATLGADASTTHSHEQQQLPWEPIDVARYVTHTVPLSQDAHRVASFEAAITAVAALQSRARGCSAGVVVLDSGIGNLTLTAARAYPTTRVLAVVPHAPALGRLVQAAVVSADRGSDASDTGASMVNRVTVLRSLSQLMTGSPHGVGLDGPACAVFVDMAPGDAGMTASQLRVLSGLYAAGLVGSDAYVVPEAIQPVLMLVETPTLAAFTTVSAPCAGDHGPTPCTNATAGVDMSGMARNDAHCPAAWVSSRPTPLKDVDPWRALGDPTPSMLLHTTQVAALAVTGQLPATVGGAASSLRASYGGRVDAIVQWFDIVLTAKDVVTASSGGGPRSRTNVIRGGPPYLGVISGAVGPHGAEAVVPAGPDTTWVRAGDGVDVAVTLDNNYIISPRLVQVVAGGGGDRGGAAEQAVHTDGSSSPPAVREADPTCEAQFPYWHLTMLNDQARNEAYAAAIQRAVARVGAGAHVLDLGAGAGLLSVLAARAGAGIVTAVEANAAMVPRLRRVVADNGVGDTVAVAPVHSLDLCVAGEEHTASPRSCAVTMPRRADVIVHEIFDFTVDGEGVRPSVADALERLAVPNAQVVPAGVVLMAMVVESDELVALYGDVGGGGGGARGHESAVRGIADAVVPVDLRQLRYRALTDAVPLHVLDLRRRSTLTPGTDAGPAVVAAAVAHGRADAVVTWFDVTFRQGDAAYRTAPHVGPSRHFYQGAQLLPRRLAHDDDTRGGAADGPGPDMWQLQPVAVQGSGGFPGVRARVSPVVRVPRRRVADEDGSTRDDARGSGPDPGADVGGGAGRQRRKRRHGGAE